MRLHRAKLFIGLIISGLFLRSISLEANTPEKDCKTYYLDIEENIISDRLSCIENDVPLPYNRIVKGFIDYFVVRNRDYTKAVLNQKELFFPIFEEALERHNLPDELKYLAIVESGLNPKAVSPAYAVGLWQFVNGTGRYYGLKADILIDDRMDPYLSTEAACKYLKSLYGMFNDWPLALAAYNCGPGNVRKAIRRSGYKRDFWEVYRYLPRETRSYVPQFIAITYVMNYSNEHLLFADEEFANAKYASIKVNQNLSLNVFAEQLGVDINELRRLNPQIKKDLIQKHREDYQFRIPAYALENFQENKKEILDASEKLNSSEVNLIAKIDYLSPFGKEKHVYRVKSGDVLGLIAEKYKVRVSHIRKWNSLRSNTIRVGQNLVIWKLPGFQPSNTTTYARNSPVEKQNIPADKLHMVKPGETLWNISRMYEGLSIEKIKQLNNLQTDKIKPGQKLRIG